MNGRMAGGEEEKGRRRREEDICLERRSRCRCRCRRWDVDKKRIGQERSKLHFSGQGAPRCAPPPGRLVLCRLPTGCWADTVLYPT